ncbi:DnaA N-terminal domain-containing protein, partial [Achromobacter sp.]|uniref:DnaA N-terminal domain-containing protein n=1 Tax=Achromobacter sp. TaxID=134375 RepID=UPI003C761F57
MKEFWQTCVSRLEQELPPQQISAWIRPLVPLAYDETQAVLRVAAPNRFKLDWVRKNFSHQIEALAAEWFERPVQVLFELPSQGAAPRMPVAPVRAQQPAQPYPSGGYP